MPEATKKARMETVDPGPSLNRSPMEARLRGFGAGMQEGLSNLTSPAQLAGMASMLIPGAGLVRGAGAGLKAAPGAIRGLAGAAPVAEAASALPNVALPAEMLGVGGETAYNAVRQGAKPLQTGVDAFLKAARQTEPTYVQSLQGLARSR